MAAIKLTIVLLQSYLSQQHMLCRTSTASVSVFLNMSFLVVWVNFSGFAVHSFGRVREREGEKERGKEREREMGVFRSALD